MPPITLLGEASKSRKERRKEERLAKKKSYHRGSVNNISNDAKPSSPSPITKQAIQKSYNDPKKMKTTSMVPVDKRKSSMDGNSKRIDDQRRNDPYSGLDPSIAAALRRDDEEIAMLESKLLLRSKSSKSKSPKDQLQREYSKQEGYGNDFIDFLDDLDLLVQNVVVEKDDNNARKRKYKTLNADDAEDANDDDDFSDASSEMADSDVNSSSSDDGDDVDVGSSQSEIDDSDENSEEILPMKQPAIDDDEYGDDIDYLSTTSKNRDQKHSDDEYDNDDNNDDIDDEDEEEEEPDHDIADVYQPSKGEDIYGNIIDTSKIVEAPPKKYIPPHLRKSRDSNGGSSNSINSVNTFTIVDDNDESAPRKEMLRDLQRLLNNALNRLSETTIISIVQTISQIYTDKLYPTADINSVLLDHVQNACVINQSIIMSGLIPIYVATVVGVHIQKGDTIQLVEYLLEKVVTRFWNELQTIHCSSLKKYDGDDGIEDKEVPTMSNTSKQLCNLVLVVCYMYNFGVVHCTLLYDIIRHLIEHCYEADVELLLLLLNHCGRTLRSDDPNALKEIMTLVQQKQATSGTMNTSRAQYMVETLMELKKTKRRKQDQPIAEQTLKLRKVLGHIKSNTTAKGRTSTSSSDSSLRITLRDILDVDTKGRWWKVGASWNAGRNPSQLLNADNVTTIENNSDVVSRMNSKGDVSDKEDKLLQLAAKYRMNTDARRTIFCIIMGGTDYEDCFEKLVRAGMIKNRSERDTVRVLMECCCNEKAFNPYYAHLAARICDFQPQCKFTFQLAYWDTFKQLDDYKPRKVANLAKLLFHLVAIHQCLKLTVIKAIDIATPEQLSESALIFVTIFLSSILEHFDDPKDTLRLFEKGTRDNKRNLGGNDDKDDNDMFEGDNGIQASITIFLVQVLKASPKYQKGSKFRTNLKVAIKACDTDNFF